MTGKVKRNLNVERGYGFVASGSRDYFLHVNNITDPYLEFDESLIDREVEFDVQDSPKGQEAVNVRAAQ